MELYHISPQPGIKRLYPHPPAEDVVNGELVWQDEADLTPCVCFARNLEQNLHCNPVAAGFVYTPVAAIDVREFWNEIPAGDFLDSTLTKEVRSYVPVDVVCIGKIKRLSYLVNGKIGYDIVSI